MKHLKSLKKTLGPGILFASTAIGVSHLVQTPKLVLYLDLDCFGR